MVTIQERALLEIEAIVKDESSRVLKEIRRSARREIEDGATSSFEKWGKTIFNVRNLVIGLAGALSGVAAANKAIDIAQEARDFDLFAQKLGQTNEELDALVFAAEQRGIEREAALEGLKTLQERLDDAAMGAATYADQFDKIGVSVSRADGTLRSVSEVIGEIAEGLEGLSVEERVLFGEDIFGGESNFLTVFLAEGREELERLLERAREIGPLFTEAGADAADNFLTAFGELRRKLDQVFRDLFVDAEPTLTAAAQTLVENFEPIATAIRDIAGAVGTFILDSFRLVIRGVSETFDFVSGILSTFDDRFVSSDELEQRIERQTRLIDQWTEALTTAIEEGRDPGGGRIRNATEQIERLSRALAENQNRLRDLQAPELTFDADLGNIFERIRTSFEQNLANADDRVRADAISRFIGDLVPVTREGGREAGEAFGESFGSAAQQALEGSQVENRVRGILEDLGREFAEEFPAIVEDAIPDATVLTGNVDLSFAAAFREESAAIADDLLNVEQAAIQASNSIAAVGVSNLQAFFESFRRGGDELDSFADRFRSFADSLIQDILRIGETIAAQAIVGGVFRLIAGPTQPTTGFGITPPNLLPPLESSRATGPNAGQSFAPPLQATGGSPITITQSFTFTGGATEAEAAIVARQIEQRTREAVRAALTNDRATIDAVRRRAR